MATRRRNGIHAVNVNLFAIAALCVALAAQPSVARADPLGAGSGTIYRLGPESSYQNGCFPPCLCPILLVDGLRGTFKLTFTGTDATTNIHSYAVDDVNWTVPIQDPNLRIVGSGRYQIGSPDPITVVQHRMQLDLRVGDGVVEHFDSGWVSVGQLAGIHITVSMNGMVCFDTVLEIAAEPVPPNQIQNYSLVEGSTFQRGCFDPCDCLLEEERPMMGSFDLVPLSDNGTWAEFAVVNVDWMALSNSLNEVIPIAGFGVYQRFAEFAVQHRLSLDLIVDDENRAHFDSGLIVSIVPFPRIDIVVTMNEMVCFDTVLRVVADPSGETVCGGFAGIPCPANEFCKFPIGTCHFDDIFGICAPIPNACPEIYDPVCGCDGVTYDNECEADRVMVTIAHAGACAVFCQPSPDGFGCTAGPCSAIPEESCLATLLHLDIATGAITTLACDCFDFNVCHIEFGNASPFAVGFCPNGGTCQVFAADTDGDGIDDQFSAHCVPAAIGACCLDIDDGPIAYDTCVSTDQDTCQAEGGIFQSVNSACGDMQACCFTSVGIELCNDMNPWCCLISGGIAQGVGSTCADLPSSGGCGQPCGGFAYTPCDDPDQFCMLPPGGCCCDIMGVCATPPEACPLVFDPVCGCDGVTYGNACEAAMAAISIDHTGPCDGNCPDVWDPVCGVDGVTYSNACFAELAGVPIAHFGECGAMCGGLGPHPPCDQGTFCKYPPGVCGDPFLPGGECTPIPNGCPDVSEPVCGCDGNTYGNECEADAAAVSIDHPGECTGGECAATRVLSDPDPSYCSGVPKMVRILLTPPVGVTAVALNDTPPAGWTVSHISNGGTFDAINGKVKWGPFFAPDVPPEVTYDVTSAAGDVGVACFEGEISLDGVNGPVCGGDCIAGEACCPFMDADLSQPHCAACPAADCAATAESCADGRISLTELAGYACAWMTGCNDDLSGMTRAAFVWRNGECYCWDDADLNWHPTTCPASDSGCCTPSGRGSDSTVGAATAVVTWDNLKKGVRSSSDGGFSWTRELEITVTVEPPPDTSATAVAMWIPRGWTVVTMSDGGQWDEIHRKLKWGPTFGDLAQSMTLRVRWRAGDAVPVSRRSARGGLAGGFEGVVSFDGVNQPISMR